MVFGLLALAAIPTTIGVAEGISSTKKKGNNNEEEDPTVSSTTEAQRMRKFRLQCYCDAPSSKSKEINGGTIVLRDDKVRYFSRYPGYWQGCGFVSLPVCNHSTIEKSDFENRSHTSLMFSPNSYGSNRLVRNRLHLVHS